MAAIALRVSSLVLLGVSLVSAASAEPPPPLLEVQRTRLETPWAPASSWSVDVAISADAPVAYTLGEATLFTIDTHDGSTLDTFDLLTLEDQRIWRLVLLGSGAGARLVLWGYGERVLHLFSLADPRRPVYLRAAGPFGVADYDEIRSLRPLPGGAAVLLQTYYAAALVDGEGTQVHAFAPLSHPWGRFEGFGVGGSAERPIVAAVDSSRFASPPIVMGFYDVSVPAVPVLISSMALTEVPSGILVDARAEIAVLARIRYEGGTLQGSYDVLELGSLQHVASVEPAGKGSLFLLAEGSGGRVLVTVDAAGVDLIDLTDPSSPVVRGRVTADLPFRPWLSLEADLAAASPRDPVVYVAALGEAALLSIDVRTGSELARVPFAGPIPGSVFVGGPGASEGIVVAWRRMGGEVFARGGTAEMVLLDLSDPASPTEHGRFLRNQPLHVDGLVTVGGVHAVASDLETNSLALCRLSDGTVLDVTGLFVPAYGYNWRWDDGSQLQGAGRFVLVMSTHAFEVFEVEGSHLVPRQRGEVVGSYVLGRLRSDGIAIVVGWDYATQEYFLETRLPDGTSGRIALPEGDAWNMVLSPREDLVLLGFPSFYEGEAHALMIDLAAPLAPGLLWDGLIDYASAAFDDGGTRLFVTYDRWDTWDGGIAVRNHDARTGEPLGDELGGIAKFFYHDIGTSFGKGDEHRVVVWRWTWAGWETLLFDAGSATPTLPSVLPEFFAPPHYLARDGGGWYELHERYDLSGGVWSTWTDFLLASADGEQVKALRIDEDHELPRGVRHGFFATAGGYRTPGVVSLWRDTARNRPPAAQIEGERAIECTSRQGTPVLVDGSASSDPDSTPGTEDELASFAWVVDGAPAGVAPAMTVDLSLGAHAVALEVADVLGAVGTGSASIEVSDTLPPEVRLALVPVLSGATFANQWTPRAVASDLCDGAIAPTDRLLLPPGASEAPVSFRRAAAPAIEVRAGRSGLETTLLGPDEASLRAIWETARATGGFALVDGAPVGLALAATDGTSLARYELGAGGGLVRASAFGATGDLVVEASATDGTGRGASAATSLRAAIDALCAGMPQLAACVPR